MHFIKLATSTCMIAAASSAAQLSLGQTQSYEQVSNMTVSAIVNDFRYNGDVTVLRGLIDIAFAALQSEAAMVASCLQSSSTSAGRASPPATSPPSSSSILNPVMPNPPPLSVPVPVPAGPPAGPPAAPPAGHPPSSPAGPPTNAATPVSPAPPAPPAVPASQALPAPPASPASNAQPSNPLASQGNSGFLTSIVPNSQSNVNGSMSLSSNISSLPNGVGPLSPLTSGGSNPIGGLVSGLGGTVTGALGGVAGGLPTPLGGVVSSVNSAAGGVLSGVGGVVSNVAGAAGALPTAVGGVVSDVGEGVGVAVTGVGGVVTSVVGGVAGALPTPLGGVVSGVGSAAGGAVSGVGAAVSGVAGGLGGAVGGLLGAGALPSALPAPTPVSGVLVSATNGAVATCTDLICLQTSLPGLLGLNLAAVPTGGSGGSLLNVGVKILGGGNVPAAAPAVTTNINAIISAASQVSSVVGASQCSNLICLQASLPGVISLSAGAIPTSGANLGNLLGVGLNLFGSGQAPTMATVSAGTGSALVAAVTTSVSITPTSVAGQPAPTGSWIPVTSWMYVAPAGLGGFV
ncbi:hypothetical protein QM012_007733 [Aureobasidium pullulans]|uniref:Uncharacterized protein n=1 Tax=Aureobasidium pullulans TaxID=5580 RepID=A0ABR0TKH1_AURPU